MWAESSYMRNYPARYSMMSTEQRRRLLRLVQNCKRIVSKYVVNCTAITTAVRLMFTRR